MSDDNRSLWKENEHLSTEKKSPFRLPILVVIGFIPATLIMMSTVQIAVWPDILKYMVFYNRLAFAIIVTVLIEGSILHSNLASGSISRSARIIRVFLLFTGIGMMVAAVLFLAIAYLSPYSSVTERLILPALVAIFSTILAFFTPVMPIWRLDIPDNQVWMLLDRNDHLVKYLKAGVRTIRPIDGFAPYTEAGIIDVRINEDIFSQDGVPFRASVIVGCLFSPLLADESMRVTLRDMPRKVLDGIIKDDTLHVTRDSINRWDHIDLADPQKRLTIMRSIRGDIKEAVEARANMGVILLAQEPIKLNIEPLNAKVAQARADRIAIEGALIEEYANRMNIKEDNKGKLVAGLQANNATASQFDSIIDLVSNVVEFSTTQKQQDHVKEKPTPPLLESSNNNSAPPLAPPERRELTPEATSNETPPVEVKPDVAPPEKPADDPDIVDVEKGSDGVYRSVNIPDDPMDLD